METSETINILPTLVPFVLVLFVIAVGVVLLNQQFRKNLYKKQLEQEGLEKTYQHELLLQAVQIQEDERKRIAQDLHDELGAGLSIGRMQLVQLEKQATIDVKDIYKIRKLIENTLSSTRRISHQLMPLQLENLGLEKALHSLCQGVGDSDLLEVNIAISEKKLDLHWLIELGVYRIYSELINNTIKYAEASVIDISIIKSENYLFCNYSDNGKGLNENTRTIGLGIKSIQNRINTLGGSWNYGNGKEEGFYAQMKLPIETKNTRL